ncbi:hypothetical protein AXF42_Ash012748 [Apostasia shenzhenica]|uniref:Uncharacterized protein n=1 Tax=Apostasia shenzhenica TaxID=1088818 RepID=A0A2I0AM18_9ASPA|nr:hypothetical protein AXF42_Ash012748 [Apostasia shenzhenica]
MCRMLIGLMYRAPHATNWANVPHRTQKFLSGSRVKVMASDEVFAGEKGVAGKEYCGAPSGLSHLAIQIFQAGEEADDQESAKSFSSAAGDDVDAGGDERSERRVIWASSLPATPEHWRGIMRRQGTERTLERAWEMRRIRAAGHECCECMVVVQPRGGCRRSMCMDIDEIRACRDLGLEIPREFTVEISPATAAPAIPLSEAGAPPANGKILRRSRRS